MMKVGAGVTAIARNSSDHAALTAALTAAELVHGADPSC